MLIKHQLITKTNPLRTAEWQTWTYDITANPRTSQAITSCLRGQEWNGRGGNDFCACSRRWTC